MFCYILVEEGVDEFFFIQDLHLNFHSFFGFQHGSIPSVQAIMWLLSLAIGLKCFWFLVALLLYPKSNIPELFFLDPRDLCLPNQFSRGSWQKLSVSTYLIWCQRRNWVASMIWWLTLIFDPSYVCHDIDINIIWPASFVKFHCHYWTEFSQSWKDVTKTLRCHGNLQLLTDLIMVLTMLLIQVPETGYFECSWCQNQSIHEQEHPILERCVNSIFYLFKKYQKYNSKVRTYHSRCVDYIYLYQNYTDSVVLISKSAQHCTILEKIDVLNTCGAMICPYFGIVIKFHQM